jgi:riboflavin synthase
MFTGLIEALGRVVERTPGRGSTRLAIASSLPVPDMKEGESVAVDGVCLTVARREGDRFCADAIAETLSRTTLAGLRRGDDVNLERAMQLGDRLGGHLVQGHVDDTARVREVRRRGDDVRIRLALPPALRRYVAFKGSVTLQGVSLTVSAVEASGFEVALIPETLTRMTLGRLKAGDRVNVEVDLISRYLERLVQPPGDSTSGGVGRTVLGS